MDKVKQWVALTVVGVLAVLAAGWFLLVSPKRSEAADVRAQTDTQLQDNNSLETKLAMLKQQAKTLPAQQAKLAAVAAKIPDNPALPSLIRALSDAADASGVELVSVAPGAPAVFTASTVAAPAAPAGPAGSTVPGGSTTPAGTQTLSSPSSASAAGALQTIPVVLNVVGGYFNVEQFFDHVEQLTRAVKVTGFTLAPGSNPLKPVSTGAVAPTVDDGRVLVANVNASIYMAPGRIATTPTVPAAN